MRRDVYVSHGFWKLLGDYAKKKGMSRSKVLREGAYYLMYHFEENKKIKNKLDLLMQKEKILCTEEFLRFEVKKMFFQQNLRIIMLKGIEACSDIKQVKRVLRYFKEIAKIMKHKHALEDINGIAEVLKNEKKIEAVKQEVRLSCIKRVN